MNVNQTSQRDVDRRVVLKALAAGGTIIAAYGTAFAQQTSPTRLNSMRPRSPRTARSSPSPFHRQFQT
jgi:hypothetical protein